jgi:Mg2+ and Co2+ transporter CorA
MMIAGIYGMNILDPPLSDKPPAFETIFGIPVMISVMISVVMGLLMGKKKIC